MGHRRHRRAPGVLLVTALVAGVLATLATYGPTGVPPAAAAGGDISRVAGGFVPGPTPATSISTAANALARNGNQLYVSDAASCVIRRVDLVGGTQVIAAGAGSCGYAGDGGPATAATLGLVNGLAFNAAGDLYLAENGGRIRRVSAGSGIITTVAGTGVSGFSGDGGPAANAQLNQPSGLAVDGAGNLYIAERGNNRVRKVNGTNGIITTFAGGGASIANGVPATSAVLSAPYDVKMTPAGNVVIAEGGGSIVRTVSLPSGLIDDTAGNRVQGSTGDGGPATSASINGPVSVSYDASGNLLIADYSGTSNVIRRVAASNGVISTVAGNGLQGYSGDGGPATAAKLSSPIAVVAGTGTTFYIADTFNYRVRAVTAGTIDTIAGNGQLGRSGDGGQATSAQFVQPAGLAADAAGNVYISDPSNFRVMKVTAATGVISVYAGGGAANPGDGGPATSADIEPYGLAIDGTGNLFISERFRNRVRRVDAVTKVITTYAGTGASGFSGDGGPATAATFDLTAGVTLDAAGNLFVIDYRNGRVRRVDATTKVITTVVGGGASYPGDGLIATQGSLQRPNDVAVDATGNLFVTDWTTDSDARVRRVDATTKILSTISGQGANPDGDGLAAVDAKLTFPGPIEDDNAGRAYIGEAGKKRIRRIDTNGLIDTIAGGGTGALGDGGPARAASFNGVNALAFDNAGNLLLGDGNRLVRRVTAPFSSGGGGFHAVVPTRLLDSRTPVGGWNAKLAAGAPRTLTVAGTGGVPATATAVVMNVTATEGTAGSFLTAYPAGTAPPNASNLNFAAGQTIPNLVTVKVGAGGQVAFANAVGSVDVVADLVGYFDDGTPGGDLFNGVSPARILDSRGPTGGWAGPLGAGVANERTLAVRGHGGVSATATAVVMNVTVTGGTAGSFLQVWPADASRPNSSNLNFAPGQTTPNLVTVKLSATGQVKFHNEVGATHVIADVVGYFDPGSGNRFHPLAGPTRLLDSRIKLGVPGSWNAGMSRAFNITAAGGFRGATSLIMNTTATNGTAGSFVSVYPQGPLPNNSNLNFAPGETIANLVMTKVAANGYLELYNELGTVDLVGDVVGYYAPG